MRPSLRSLTCCWPSSALLLSLVLAPLTAVAFTFTSTSPTQCDPFTVNWTGGQPPFNLLILPLESALANITIPSSAFTNNVGSFTTAPLAFSQGQRILFTISDAVGLSSGGITSVLTVGQSTSNTKCKIISATPDFYFSLNGDLEQCNSYSNAVQPITIFGFVPQGRSFNLHPPIGDSFTWTSNLTAGTPIAFAVIDSQGRSGGSSDIRVVQSSDDQSLTTTLTAGEPKNSNKLPVAVAAAVGGVAVITLVVALLICLRRRKKIREKNRFSDIGLTGLLSGVPRPGHGPSSPGQIVPFNLQAGSSSSMDHKPSSRGSSSNGGTSSSMYAPLRSTESSLQGHNNSGQRIVVHTDIADTPIDEPVELPPRYSDRRTPIPGLISSTIPTSIDPTIIIAPVRKS
ncbi:hypothetical protein BJ912DRAFT_1037443 [Pholiota molesta]|nr:hypothetical protein BJ912DRAFT_1037443 [Pholiota molesta]